ncbi:hypothetical protein T484DRAFT_3631191 [Baffinella frigidus]|nr:hypothetical protein T484DRAFT_3631191 [Cryptophyta sp. CCMP2293]
MPPRNSHRRLSMRSFSIPDVHNEMCDIFDSIYTRYGPRCSEALYQRATVRRVYLDGIPCMSERELYANVGEGHLLVGRIDLEVASSCLYEFKVGPVNVAKDSEQVNKYLRAYDLNGETIQIASLIYFTPDGVVVHDVRNNVQLAPVGCACELVRGDTSSSTANTPSPDHRPLYQHDPPVHTMLAPAPYPVLRGKASVWRA